MKNINCVHPIKARRIMKRFCEDTIQILTNEDNEEIAPIISFKEKKNHFGVTPFLINEDELHFYYSYENLQGDVSVAFRKNFEKDCPCARGFADITITLLHEIGHVMTFSEIPTKHYDRRVFLSVLATFAREMENIPEREFNEKYYFKLPDEKLATTWAQKWLEDADNRKYAKAFEKEFFKCFE